MEKRKDSKKRLLKTGEYQRANGTYEFRWQDRIGKRHSIYSKSLSELREKENDVMRDILNGKQFQSQQATVNDVYYRWKEIKRGLKPNTFQNYCYMYEQFVESTFGNMRLVDVKKTDVRAFYNRLSDEHHLRAYTIDNVHTVLHQVFDIAVDDDYIRFNPSDNALKELKKAHSDEKQVKRALTIQEQRLFESFLRKQGVYDKWYPVFYIMLWTGLRVGEATGLRWCDIDLDNGTIDVNHTLVYYSKGQNNGGCSYIINTPKTKAGQRVIPMTKEVKQAFLMQKEKMDAFGIHCKITIDGYTDFVFLNRFGDVLNMHTLNKALNRIIRDCNYEVLDNSEENEPVLLPHFSNHTLRHTFSTRMCEAGINIKAMQAILGHKDAETTLNIYTDATMELKRKELTNLNDYFL